LNSASLSGSLCEATIWIITLFAIIITPDFQLFIKQTIN
jgi:hypothetical protein